MGYVGCVSLGCLAQDGHHVIGVDANKEKIRLINQGKPTIIEKFIDKIIEKQHKKGRIKATDNYEAAVCKTDVTIICVGTPSTDKGHLNLKHIFTVAEQLGESLKKKEKFHTVVIRSTVSLGTNYEVGKIIEKKSGKKRNIDFGIVSNPEFMREGSAVEDYYNPVIIVLGSDNKKALKITKKIYKNINAPIEETEIEVAEIIKYVNNSFHALKISFANEIGNICKKLGIDSHQVMNLFCRDYKLNISPNYFKPGSAYGGSCLSKDLKGLKTLAHDNYLPSPVLESIERSNDNQKEIAFQIIISKNKRNIGIIGLSFKPGTDDLRYSPTVELVERLLGKGYRLKIYDESVYISKLMGTNKKYIEKHIPHLSDLITGDLGVVIKESDVLVVTHNYKELPALLKKYPGKIIVDLISITDNIPKRNYEGICW